MHDFSEILSKSCYMQKMYFFIQMIEDVDGTLERLQRLEINSMM